MDFFELTSKRHSIRNFSDKLVEKEKIEKILSAVRTAPSAGNLKAYDVVVVTDEKKLRELGTIAARSTFVGTAQVVFVFFAVPKKSAAKYNKRGEKLYCLQDATIACTYAQLAATELGLGSCWIGSFVDEEVKRILNVHDESRPVALLPVGYAG